MDFFFINRAFTRLCYTCIFGYILVIALSAQLTYDLHLPNVTIPVSGQTLAILTGAVFLAPMDALLGILLYSVLGIIGLPIFADGGSGWAQFSGSSFGYFVGFAIAAYLTSYLTPSTSDTSFLKLIGLMIIGTAIILGCGTAWLALEHGVTKAIEYGCTPFIAGGIVKVILGAGIAMVIQWVLRNQKNKSTES